MRLIVHLTQTDASRQGFSKTKLAASDEGKSSRPQSREASNSRANNACYGSSTKTAYNPDSHRGIPQASNSLDTVSTNHGKDDLLSFQSSHFGDHTKPDAFFVDPEYALNYCPEVDRLGEDGLGWYDDGIKRTLTDEQIQMFRHSEIQQLLRVRRLQAEEEAEQDDDDDYYEPPEPDVTDAFISRPRSPVSDASSLEAELFDIAPTKPSQQRKSRHQPKRQPSRTSHSQSVQSGIASSPRSRQRKFEVPYDQRNKRKWESYIDGEDPIHGSMTHRRLVRELDGQQGQNTTMDYGDDEPAPSKPSTTPAMPERRIISYEDD